MQPGKKQSLIKGAIITVEFANYFSPTHLTFVASSSYDGANFAGAIVSTLVVDVIAMVYK